MEKSQDISCGRTCQGHFPQITERTSDASSKAFAKPKMKPYQFLKLINGNPQAKSWEIISPSVGELSMRNTGEFPNEENASTLSQILQVGVQEKYYLSQKACLGILKRASARGKELPTVLRLALEYQASA